MGPVFRSQLYFLQICAPKSLWFNRKMIITLTPSFSSAGYSNTLSYIPGSAWCAMSPLLVREEKPSLFLENNIVTPFTFSNPDVVFSAVLQSLNL